MFVPKAEVKLPAKKEDFAAWKAGLVKQLREKSFRALPEKVPAAINRTQAGPGIHTLSSEEGVEFFMVPGMNAKAMAPSATMYVLNPEERYLPAARS